MTLQDLSNTIEFKDPDFSSRINNTINKTYQVIISFEIDTNNKCILVNLYFYSKAIYLAFIIYVAHTFNAHSFVMRIIYDFDSYVDSFFHYLYIFLYLLISIIQMIFRVLHVIYYIYVDLFFHCLYIFLYLLISLIQMIFRVLPVIYYILTLSFKYSK
jgi:hypothetical protein